MGTAFRSVTCGVASFLAGVLIDLDHLFDYYYTHPLTINPKKVYDACMEMNLKRWFLFLHSYELITAFWVIIFFFGLSNIWKAVAIGFTQHLVFDQLFNPINTYGYFLTFAGDEGVQEGAYH